VLSGLQEAGGADLDAIGRDAGGSDAEEGSEDEDEVQSLVVRDRVHQKLSEAVQKEQGRLVKPFAHLVCVIMCVCAFCEF
jgi:hypothetical protein